ncbi:MAG: FtsW/RodA/SpoVE family cell cycle protein [Oscillospiraceae bacterium]|nr:FtsW/RodA/SpoVE family cell cycle protein [Oscillospiraceae bacterium]
MPEIFDSLQGLQGAYLNVLIAVMRFLAPAIAALLLFRCFRPLLSFRREPEIWAWLCLSDGTKLPITHWENVIGRHKKSDIVIDFPTVSRSHGVLTRYDDGSWTITDTDSSGGIMVNGKKVRIWALQPEDVISIGGIEMTLQPISRRQEQKLAQLRTKASTVGTGICNVLLLTIFQILTCLIFMMCAPQEAMKSVFLGFCGIAAMQWLLLLFYICIRRTSFEVETIAFFMCTMGMAVIATVTPTEAMKQLIAIAMGLFTFLLIGWSLRNLERAKKMRYLAAVAGIGFLVITLLFGQEIYGAKNWLIIGPLSLQPSELSKVCFVFIGASTMDRLMKKRNLISFIVYSVMVCGCLALMNDFGTALIFFCAFLVIAYLRSGSVGTLGLAVTALGFAGVVALKIAPHALRRFASWRHIWEDPLGAGYQQTRTLMCMASGGLFGLGAGQGYMKNVFAADSDMVVGTITEEWGLVMLVLLIFCVVALAFFTVRSAAVGRSSFYTIGSCTAASIMLVQVILNALGTVDVLPLTGVTFPFISNGGSSMICSWGLLAFIKAADTRQNASFAVRLTKKGGAVADE